MQHTPMPPAARMSVDDYLLPHAHASGPIVVANAGGSSPHVLTAARLLSTSLDTVPLVVAVNEPLPFYISGGAPEVVVPPELYDLQRERLRVEVERSLGATDGGGDPAWTVEIVDGQPARALADVARRRGARLIVMGIGRHAPMDRVFGGETALQVIRLADRPVLAVTRDFRELPRRAVAALDFSAASVRAAVEALGILADGGTLVLVHVHSPSDQFTTRGGESLRSVYTEGVSRLLERLATRLETALAGRRTITIEKAVLRGDPAEDVLSYARVIDADLIAVGSSGAGFFERLVVGSVATRIVRRSPVPVLAVPRPSAAMVETIERALSGEPVGTVESREKDRWPALLEAFTERNAGRATRLEVDDPAVGAQSLRTG